jgi:hypothetical protein
VSSVTSVWSGATKPTPIPPGDAERYKAALEKIRAIADDALGT